MAGSISVTEGAAAAFGFFGRSWRRAAGSLALAGLLNGANTLAFLNRDFARAWPLFGAYLLALVMAMGGLFRIARNLSPGFGGFQWGAVEWRLLGVLLLRALLFSLLAALFLLVLVVVYVGVAAAENRSGFTGAARVGWRPSLDPLGWLVVSGVGLAGLAGLCWVALRLYLAEAATVAMGQVQLLSTWVLTRRSVWRVLGSLILALLPAIAVVLAVRLGGALFSRGGGDRAMTADLLSLVAGVSQTFLILPLSVGLMVYLYDRLGPEDAGVS